MVYLYFTFIVITMQVYLVKFGLCFIYTFVINRIIKIVIRVIYYPYNNIIYFTVIN